MSSDYSTIQGHEPLRVPQGWQQQERAFVVQLEEILDDIYRRFGRLRVKDLGSDLKKIVEDVDGLSYAQYEIDVEGIRTEVGKKVDQTTLEQYSTTQQTAAQISSYVQNSLTDYSTTSQTAAEIQTKINNSLQDYSTTSQTAAQISSQIQNSLSDYSTTAQTATQISTQINNSLQDYSTTSQTATEIQTKINNSLQDYSTTSQTATQISQYVTNNAYPGTHNGMTINANGISMTGSQYIKLVSGKVQAGDWYFGNNGMYYQDSDGMAYEVQYSKSNDTTMFSTNSKFIFCPDFAVTGVSLSGVYDSSYQKYRINFEAYPTTSDALISFGTWTNHADQVCTNYLYYWNGGYQSSRDYKHDIRPLEPSGDKLDELEPVRFKYNGDDKERIGLIYEDAVDIVPEICSEHDGHKAIDYGGLVPMLLKEIQSLRTRVAALENKG